MISTKTLELGIDIGNIDAVIQVKPPYDVSSFLQRVGRSGRRSKVQRAVIIAQDFEILQSLAVLMLNYENEIANWSGYPVIASVKHLSEISKESIKAEAEKMKRNLENFL